ncbi:MAG: hypothetical protein ACTSPD_21900 [Promethearchaeota archaeon]
MRAILGDAFINNRFIFEVIKALENRNNSIFAHGIVSITKRSYNLLKKCAERLLQAISIEVQYKKHFLEVSEMKKLTDLFSRIL